MKKEGPIVSSKIILSFAGSLLLGIHLVWIY